MNQNRLLLALSLAIGCAHASLAQIDPVTLREDLSAGKFESLQQVRDADVDAILPVIRGYVIGMKHTISKPALEAIRSVPNLVPWVGQDLQKRIALGRLDFTVDEDFEMLGRLRTPDAVREIGRHINNDAILKSPSDDLASNVVSVSAALSLSLVGFSNAATPNLWWGGGLGESELKGWKKWWKENQASIDKLVKEANDGPPPAPAKPLPATPQATDVPQSTPLLAASTPRLSATVTPTVTTEKSSSSFPIVPVAILVLAIIGVAVFFLRRKSS